MKTLVVILSLCLFLSAGAQPMTGSANVDQAVKRFCESLMESFKGGDIDRVLSLDTNTIVVWQNGEITEGRPGIRSYVEKMTKGEYATIRKVTFEPKILGAHVQGDWAIAWGDLNDHFVLSGGKDLPLNSRFTATLAKDGDSWKLSVFHASVNAFSSPITEMAVKKIALIAGVGGIITGAIVGLVIASLLRRTKNPN
jgi:ketosteroid isomerase-like protein